jgi:hypothetical protein
VLKAGIDILHNLQKAHADDEQANWLQAFETALLELPSPKGGPAK